MPVPAATPIGTTPTATPSGIFPASGPTAFPLF